MNSLAEIAVRLHQAQHILVTAHIMPDGDSIGSLLGLGLALKRAGKTVTMFSADGVPKRYSFLGGAGQVVADRLPEAEYDCVVVLDSSDENRIKPVWEQIKGKTVINIDHHPTNRQYGQMNFVNAKAAATGEIVWHLLEEMNLPVDEYIATALYVAISTDTGSFKYESTTPQTHRVTATLLEAGVMVAEITPQVFDMRSRTAVCILSEALQTLSYSQDGQIAWIVLTDAEMERCGARDEDLDGLVNYAKNIEGVEAGLIFREKADGTVKVGFRSHKIDVGKLAEAMGGGGHARAAGCSLEMALPQALEQVLNSVSKEIAAWTEL